MNTLEAAEQATQTDRDPLVDDLNELLDKNIRLEEMLTETENRLAETDEAYTNIQTILRDYNHDRRRTIIEAGQQEIYFTAEGRAWHASYQCLRNRTNGQIFGRTWCTQCLDQLGRYPDNQAPTGSTSSRLR